jgi:CHAD domain-containing protein
MEEREAQGSPKTEESTAREGESDYPQKMGLQKRLQKLESLFGRLVIEPDPDIVHDTRVASRRLQQNLTALFPKPRPRNVQRLRKRLKRIRRLLGEWRNCDVLLDLVTRELLHAENPEHRGGWELVRSHLSAERTRHIARSQSKIEKLSAETRKLFEKLRGSLPETDSRQELSKRISQSVQDALGKWKTALSQAETTRNPQDIHTFRIATKRLRYRVEALNKIEPETQEAWLDFLKKLQESLGQWHDRQALHQAVAEAVAQPELLLRESTAVQYLLQRLIDGRETQQKALEGILSLAGEDASLTSWTRREPDAPLAQDSANDTPGS